MEKPRNRRAEALGDLQHLPDDVLCRIVGLLAPKDVGCMACVSSIFYVFCNEEPLWMHICLDNHAGLLEYKGSWKLTTLEKMGLVKKGTTNFDKAPLHFDGFTSLFLYRRWYRCHMALEGFIIPGVLERREKVTQEEFTALYDGKRPVLLTDLTEDWPAKTSWGIQQLVEKYGDIAFKVGQAHGKKVTMKLKDYASYMTQHHDEDPLYIFDSKFGKHAPALLQDYQVPHLFSEDFLGLLDEQRPPFRWLVIGPCRSGASWHVDPGLTSAWNTLLCGRKRWALYPPGRVPPTVTVHVDEEDGEVNFDGPTSLQWWVDVYPSLKDEDKPIECIQYPGETIFVPSGWWHCVLNIDSSVAVTQNFVNSANFELVCLDMAPGYRHKGIARAGNMALGQVPLTPKYDTVATSVRTSDIKPATQPTGMDGSPHTSLESDEVVMLSSNVVGPVGQDDVNTAENQFSALDIGTLLAHTQEHPDHFSSTSSVSYLGQRMLRKWLRKLWTDRPELQPRIWKCACRVLDAATWVQRAITICEAYEFPSPAGLEKLPVGNGSNPVFIIGDKVIKFYVEDGVEGSVDVLGSELEFYAHVLEGNSSLQHFIPVLVGSGFVYPDGDKFKAVEWNGVGDIPPAEGTDKLRKRARDSGRRVRTKWSRSAKRGSSEAQTGCNNLPFCPYIVMERCSGKDLASMLKDLTSDDMLAVVSFLAQQIRNLHSLSLPSDVLGNHTEATSCSGGSSVTAGGMSKHLKEGSQSTVISLDEEAAPPEVMPMHCNGRTSECLVQAESKWTLQVPWEWQNFVTILREKREHITDQFDEWGTIPDHLVKQVEMYLPQDPATAIDYLEVKDNVAMSLQPPVWIHMDIMVDNIQMKQTCPGKSALPSTNGERRGVQPSHIIDFGDINFGDPVYEFIAVYLDVFRGDVQLMKRFLEEYQLPFCARPRPSYKAMCYVLLYRIRPGRVLMHMKESLDKAKSWEEVEEQVFGFLNDWQEQRATISPGACAHMS